MYVLIGADNNALARMQEDFVLGIGEIRYLNEPIVNNDLCIGASADGHAEICPADRYRCGRAVDSIGVWLAAKMINFYTHLPQQDVKQLAKRMGSPKVFEHNAGARAYDYEAAVGEFYGGVTPPSCVDLFAGSEDVSALCGSVCLQTIG